MIINSIRSAISNKRAAKHLKEELREILNCTDYSHYEISVSYDAENNVLVVPKPVLALSLVDQELGEWLMNMVEQFPINGVVVA